MKSKLILCLLAASLALQTTASKRVNENIGKGFYKDLFMDSGISLTSYTGLPASRLLGLSMEEFVSNTKNIQTDSVFQTMIMAGYPGDENGILLYPDGAPRFRMIYLNGGGAGRHGKSLTPAGRQNLRDFIKAGGSYVGSCAGAYITSKGICYKKDSVDDRINYLGIWPGYTRGTGVVKNRTGIVLEKKSPLLKYYDFGGDLRIDSVYHNGGCYAEEFHLCPQQTEILARYDATNLKKEKITGKPVIWAYKENELTGRVIPCGSHPERVTSGERLQLMSSMIRYAMDGNGTPRIKGTLKMGEKREMKASTHDKRPEFTKIGDLQYHHYTIDVPSNVDTLLISLNSLPGWDNFDMYVCAQMDGFAWLETSTYQDVSQGFDKVLPIVRPKAGKYYISVYCATTVTAMQTAMGTQYGGRVDVLNGVPYVIKVDSKTATAGK